ncbi:MAG: matrixin family metalloprotease, partial [Phycisphaerales bacterium]
MKSSIVIASLVVLAGTGLGFAGPTPWLNPDTIQKYPSVCFEDGRVMDEAGKVGPTIDGRPASGDPLDVGPAAFCFAEGYTPTAEEWAAIQRALEGGYQSRYNAVQRWNGIPGDPIALTWSFVPDGLSTGGSGSPGGFIASNLFSRMDSLFGASNRATWINQFQRVFDRWSGLTGITYTRVTFGGNEWDDGAAWGSAGQSGRRGDIRISMHNIDGGNGILAYNQFPTNGDMVIDSSENWAQGAPNYTFLRNVVAHEHGHGIGFAHVCPANSTKLMEPFISVAYDGPQKDDIRAGQEFYGDIFETNDTASIATDIGSFTAGTSLTLGLVPSPTPAVSSTLSLSPGSSAGAADDDVDWFKLTVDVPRLVSITATPIGNTYIDVDQNSDGSCQASGVNTNSLTIGNLVITVTNSTGTTTLRVNDGAAAGVSETLTNLLLNQGTNLIKITSSQALAETQLYRLTVSMGTASFAPDASDGTFTDGVHITWPAIPGATGYLVTRANSDSFGLSAQVGPVMDASATSYVDTSANPGQLYYYFVRAQQSGSTTYRYISQVGEQGRRGIPNVGPTANAGTDIVVTDSDNNGMETVLLDGSLSTDADGTISTYQWSEGATVLATVPTPTTQVSFGVGTHVVQLLVTDNQGATGVDTVLVSVVAGGPSCDPDVNQDGNADQGDIDYLVNVVAGGENPTGIDPDFNQDGNVDQGDVDSLVNVVAGGD